MTHAAPTRTARLRAALGLTQQQFATRIGQSQSTIDRLERGQPETGPQKLLLDMIEREIAAAASATTTPAAEEPFSARAHQSGFAPMGGGL